MASTARLSQQIVEVQTKGTASARLSQQVVSVSTKGTASARLSQIVTEVETRTGNFARLSQQIVEVETDAVGFIKNAEAVSTLVLTHVAEVEFIGGSIELDAENELDLVSTLEMNKVLNLEAENTLVLDHDLNVSIPINLDADNTLALTQDLDFTQVTTIYSLIEMYHSVTSGENTFNRSEEHELNLTQLAIAHKVYPIEHTLVLSHSVDFIISKFAFNELDLVQTAVRQAIYSRTPSVTINLTDLAEAELVLGKSAENTLELTHVATKQLVKNLSADNTLVLTQELVRSKYYESTSHLIDLSQTLAYTKVMSQSISHQLSLSHTIVNLAVLNLTASNTIVFNHEHIRQVNIGGITTYLIPDVIVVKSSDYRVELQGVGAIKLPSPEFGDTDGLIGTVIVNRFKNGGKRVYRRTTNRRKLTYTFVLDAVKAKELENFVANNNSIPFRLINFKGEIWQVIFDNNPFDFATDSYREGNLGNRVTITLSFEGVRLN